jgi:hypothetical protein
MDPMSKPWASAHLENALTMKLTSHNHLKLTMASALFSLSLSVLAARGDKNHDILHVSLQKKMNNEGALASAAGSVNLRYDLEGNKNPHQDLHLKIKGLDDTVSYQLSAQVDDNTNLTQVLSFTSDHEGKADIHLREKGPKHPHDHDGHLDGQLPAELTPVTGIHQLIVSDTNGTAVLTADLTSPDKFEYLAKRDLSVDTIHAKLEIKANAQNAKLHLEASGLQAGSQYSLAINGNVASTVTATNDGHVDIHAQLENASDVFALTSVALVDASSNTVVSTTFP